MSKLIKILGPFLILAIALAGMWFGGRRYELPTLWVGVAMGGTSLIFIIGWLTMKILAIQRSLTIEKKMKDAPAGPEAGVADGGDAQAMAGMQETFTKYLAALKASPGGKGSLATLPWYLVIGAPGSGKTTAIQESGLAFSSMGHGLRSIRGIGGTRNCDWWFTDSAILLDTAGRYTTQPEDQGEWMGFLDLIKETRGRRALNGIVVVVAISDLIKGDPGSIAAVVKPIRERIIEVCSRLKLVLPVYVVFSKADLVGGFKDFFAGFPRAERDQIWGSTFAPGEIPPNGHREAYQGRIKALIGSLQTARIRALGGGKRTPAQISKLCLFPGNFVMLQQWLGEFVGELFQPMPLADQPILRGFYFTSGIHVPRPGEKAKAENEAPAQEAAKESANVSNDVSFFFQPSRAAAAGAEVVEDRRGLFLKDLFARIILPDLDLAAVPAALVRRARLLRLAVVIGSLVLGGWLTLNIIGGFLGDSALAERARTAAEGVASVRAEKPADRLAQLEGLDALRAVLVDLRDASGGTARRIEDRAQAAYFPLIDRFLIAPATEMVRMDLDEARQVDDKDQAAVDRLFDLFRVYKMLGGAIPPDRDLLDRILIDEGRWFAGVRGTDGEVGADEEAVSRRHLAYLVSVMTTAQGWQARLDKSLVERIESSLGGVLWIQQAYVDTVATLSADSGKVGRDGLVSGPYKDLVVLSGDLPKLYTPDGWRQLFQPSLADAARNLREQRFRQLQIDRSQEDIVGKLRSLYARDYNARWLGLIGDLRPAPFKDLSEASTRLRQLAGNDSPYLALAKSLSRFGNVDFGDPEVSSQVPQDVVWLGDGLKAVADFQTALDRFVTGTQSGSRSRDLTTLGELAAAADKANATFTAAVAGLEGDAVRDACAACLRNIVGAVHAALVSELGAEQNRVWQEAVVKPYTDQIAGTYPFDESAQKDAPLPTVAAIFNPKSGALWARVKEVEALRAMRWTSAELFPVSLDYDRLQQQAQVFRDACFSEGSETIAIAFQLTLVQRESVKDMSVAVGQTTFSLYDRPDRTKTFRWKQEDGGGCKVSLNLATGQWITKDFPSPGWGILRLLRDGEPTARPEGGHALTWTFTHTDKTYKGSAVLEQKGIETLVAGDYFRNLVIPPKVTR